MDYQKIYNSICDRGQRRPKTKGIYYEKHHIIPRCCKGTNDASNITTITAREHFLCHRLLTRIYITPPYYNKMLHALSMMSTYKNRRQLTAKQYELCREACSLSNSGTNHPMYGKKGTDHYNYGKRRSEEYKDYKSKATIGENNPMYNTPPWNKGKTGVYSEATTIKKRESNLGPKNPLYGKYGKNNPNWGKKFYHNPLTKDLIMCTPENKPDGFILGKGGLKRKNTTN